MMPKRMSPVFSRLVPLEDAAMVKPAVCPIASTYNFAYEGEEVVLDPSSRTFGRIACPARDGIFEFPRSPTQLRSLDDAPERRICF